MKKALSSAFMLVMVVVSLAACKKSDDGGSSGNSGGTVATTPNTVCNLPGYSPNSGSSGCNPSVYQQYAPNFQNYQWSNSGGFCGCSAGYRPVMNTQWGVSCAPDNFFPNANYYGYNYSTVLAYSQNNQWTGVPVVTYSPATSGYSAGNCYATAASVCDTRLTNANGSSPQCGNSGYCRPSAGGSYLGLCSYGAGSDRYTNPYNSCSRRWTSYGWQQVCNSNPYGYGTGDSYGGGYGIPR